MRKGRWISLGLTVGVGLMLGLNSGGVSAQEPKEGSGEVQERGILDTPLQRPGTYKPPRMSVDLVPVRVFHSSNCWKSANGQQVIVPIANLGSAPAPATILSVQFPGGIVQVNVPPINPLSLTRVAVDLPTGCSPSCYFTLRVDAGHAVMEVGGPYPQKAESNNIAAGTCSQ